MCEEDAKWPKHWPARVILELWARADFKPVFRGDRLAVAFPVGTGDIENVPRTANCSILRAFGGSHKNLLRCALTEMLREPVTLAVAHVCVLYSMHGWQAARVKDVIMAWAWMLL